jgi:hypothetical protein
MPEAARGWPFLVARGRQRGYRTVLAPDFLAERDLQGVLSDSATGDGLQPGQARVAEVDAPAVGPITLCFRIEQVSAADVNGHVPGEGAIATDEHGRPLEILYGVVARGRLSGPVHDGDLGAARSRALRSYRRFLEREDAFDVDASPAFALRGVTAMAPSAPTPAQRTTSASRAPAPARTQTPTRTPTPTPAPTRTRTRTPERPPAIGALATVAVAAVLLIVVVWFAFLRPSPTTVDVRAASAQCDARGVTLSATVSANKATTVTYHWELGAQPTPKLKAKVAKGDPRQLRFDSASATQGPYAVVVDGPQSARRAIQACATGAASSLPGG